MYSYNRGEGSPVTVVGRDVLLIGVYVCITWYMNRLVFWAERYGDGSFILGWI